MTQQVKPLKVSVEVGARFGELTVISDAYKPSPGKHRKVWCQCSCGAEKEVAVPHLRSGHTQSCGHLRFDVMRERSLVKGRRRKELRAYRAWTAMRARVARSPFYKGVSIDPSWEAFDQFLADMGEPDDHTLTLDRVDPWRGYSKDNCRWASWDDQAHNRRASRMVEYKGRSQTLARWAKELGLPYTAIRARLVSGYSPEDAFERPLKPPARKFEYAGWSRETGIPMPTLRYRLVTKGWPVDAALTLAKNARGHKQKGGKHALVLA